MTNPERIAASIVCLVVALLSLLATYLLEGFTLRPRPDSYNVGRFLWCVFSSLIGFTVIAFRVKHVPESPVPKYLTYYPPTLLAIASGVFAVCQMFDRSSGYVFYYLSFTGCFVLGFLIDHFWDMIKEICFHASPRVKS